MHEGPRRRAPGPLAVWSKTLASESNLNWIANFIWSIADDVLPDTEQIPLLEEGGIEGFFRREVLPHVPDAWIDDSRTKIGYEISFNRYFYKPEPLRPLAEIRDNIKALERETDGLLEQILVEVGSEK